MFGQCFSIASLHIYSDSPHYYRGNGFVLGVMVVGIVVTGLLRLYLMGENKRKERDGDSDGAAQMRTMSIDEIGDAHPDFMYYL